MLTRTSTTSRKMRGLGVLRKETWIFQENRLYDTTVSPRRPFIGGCPSCYSRSVGWFVGLFDRIFIFIFLRGERRSWERPISRWRKERKPEVLFPCREGAQFAIPSTNRYSLSTCHFLWAINLFLRSIIITLRGDFPTPGVVFLFPRLLHSLNNLCRDYGWLHCFLGRFRPEIIGVSPTLEWSTSLSFSSSPPPLPFFFFFRLWLRTLFCFLTFPFVLFAFSSFRCCECICLLRENEFQGVLVRYTYIYSGARGCETKLFWLYSG